MPALGWSFTCPMNISVALASLLVGHPFGGTKKRFGWPLFVRSIGAYGVKGTEDSLMILLLLILVFWSLFCLLFSFPLFV